MVYNSLQLQLHSNGYICGSAVEDYIYLALCSYLFRVRRLAEWQFWFWNEPVYSYLNL